MSILLSMLLSGILTTLQPPRVVSLATTGENVNGLPLSNPQGLAVNAYGNEFIVADALNDRVVIFDTAGAVIHTFGLGGNRHNPFGIAVNSSHEIIVSSMDRNELWIFDYDGDFVRGLTLPDDVMPGRMAIDNEDIIYLVDRAGHGILIIEKSGEITGRIESPSADSKPSGVCLDMPGDILLISSTGKAVEKFTSDGRMSQTFGEHGNKREDFAHPSSAEVDTSGLIWIVDSFRHQIKRFDSKGNFVDDFGRRGTGIGELYFPVDLKITRYGILGVLEKGSGRLQLFRLEYEK